MLFARWLKMEPSIKYMPAAFGSIFQYLLLFAVNKIPIWIFFFFHFKRGVKDENHSRVWWSLIYQKESTRFIPKTDAKSPDRHEAIFRVESSLHRYLAAIGLHLPSPLRNARGLSFSIQNIQTYDFAVAIFFLHSFLFLKMCVWRKMCIENHMQSNVTNRLRTPAMKRILSQWNDGKAWRLRT